MSCSDIVFDDELSCTTPTLEALNWMMLGGCMVGGMTRSEVSSTPLIWAMAAPMSTPGWKNTLIRPMPGMDWLSMCSTPLTVCE